jgi:type I restriction enzyme, S subunit
MSDKEQVQKESSWQEVVLGDHATFLKNLSLPRDQLSSRGEVSYLHYGDIHVGPKYRLNPAKSRLPFIERQALGSASLLEKGDLVFVDASEDTSGIGKSVEIMSVPDGGLVAGLHTIAVRFDQSVLSDGYKAYLQEIPEFRSHLIRLAAGTKVWATNRKHIASAVISLPSLSEQEKIAKVLSETDELIHSLGVLVAKKLAIKQGVMQQLLTGKTRLAGFSGEWKLGFLSEFARFQSGFSFSSKDYKREGHFLIRISNVQNGKIVPTDPIFVKVPRESGFQQYVLKADDILISLTGNVGRVARIKEEHLPAALNQRVAKIESKNLIKLTNDFLYQTLRTEVFLNFVVESSEGAAQQNTSNTAIGKFPIYLPPTLNEQIAIAEVLSDLDAEIDALLAQRKKTVLIKIGMMQELLTGRTRLG